MSVKDLTEYFDEEIPIEVTQDESWEPKLMPMPKDLGKAFLDFEDLISTEGEKDET